MRRPAALPPLLAALVLAMLALVAGSVPAAESVLLSEPTTPLLDDFDRPDENPLSQGGNWAQSAVGGGSWSASGFHIDAPLRLAGGMAADQPPSGASYNGSAWTAQPLPPGDSEVWAVQGLGTAGNTNEGMGLFLSLQNPTSASWSGYAGRFYDVIGPDLWQIWRIDAGAGTVIGAISLEDSMQAGDTLLLRRSGSALELWRGRAGVWVLKVAATDSAYTGGDPGLWIGTDDARWNGFGAGAVAAGAGDQSTGTCGAGTHAESGTACQHDPVNSLTGAFTTAVSDLTLPGIGVPFAWRRTYTSADTAAGRLGPGWTDSYQTSLAVLANGDVRLKGEEGQRVFYTRQQDGSFLGAAGARSTLASVAGGYELVRRDQVVYRFDLEGRLLSVKDRNDQGLTFAYSGSGQLETITDSVGREIALTHAGGLLSRVTLPTRATSSTATRAGA
jgi:YD repeat-containing protein